MTWNAGVIVRITAELHAHENAGFVHQGNHAGNRHYAPYARTGKDSRNRLGCRIFYDDRDHSRSWMGGADQFLDRRALSG